eukprot:scaffold20421_cov45-Attheya_sp.AAC.1
MSGSGMSLRWTWMRLLKRVTFGRRIESGWLSGMVKGGWERGMTLVNVESRNGRRHGTSNAFVE